MVFMQREKLFKCLVSLQFLNTRTHTHTHTKKKYVVNLYQKELLVCFPEDIKMWPSHNVLNWYTSNWLHNIYVDSMGLNTNVNSLIF